MAGKHSYKAKKTVTKPKGKKGKPYAYETKPFKKKKKG